MRRVRETVTPGPNVHPEVDRPRRVQGGLEVAVGDRRDFAGELELASDLTWSGIAELWAMFVRNALDREPIRIAPASAVPLPSCQASAPTPSPNSSIGTNMISGPESTSSAASSPTVAASRAVRPADDPPRRVVRKEARDAHGRAEECQPGQDQPDGRRQPPPRRRAYLRLKPFPLSRAEHAEMTTAITTCTR